jgi:hypothetical protein
MIAIVRLLLRGVAVRSKVFSTMAVGLALSACAMDALSNRIKPYIGQPASVLFSKLGYPIREDHVAGKKFYVWAVGGMTEGTSYSCNIRVVVDEQDIIRSWDGYGSWKSCGDYIERLNPNIDAFNR